MKQHACQYAIARFLPYIETGEFANVGIVICSPETGFFDFKLMAHTRRISAFFEELDIDIYRRSREDFEHELQRIRNLIVQQQNSKFTQHVFSELTRTREAMLRFDSVRVVLTTAPEQQLDKLFSHYVERNFSTKKYQEQLLDKQVRHVLKEAQLNNLYKEATIGHTNAYHAKFPFVQFVNKQPLRVIKPLYLAHDNPAKIYDHGWTWLGKIQELHRLKLLPEHVLLPFLAPDPSQHQHYESFRHIHELLSNNNNIELTPITATDHILRFARAA